MMEFKNHPVFAYAFGWCLLLVQCMIVTPTYPIIECAPYYLVSAAIFCVGLVASQSFFQFDKKENLPEKSSVPFWILVVFAIAMISKIIDRAVLRPISDFAIGGSARSSRGESNYFSVVASLLLPFLFVYFSIGKRKSTLRESLRIISGFILFLDFFLAGSRGISSVILLILYKPKTWKSIGILGLILASMASIIYNVRFQNKQEFTTDEALSISESAIFMEHVRLGPVVDWVVANLPYTMAENLIHLSAYSVHTLSEAAFVYDNEPPISFRPYLTVPNLALVWKIFNIEMVNPIREGLYYGLHGTAYIGYGLFSWFYCGIAGLWLGIGYKCAVYLTEKTFQFLFLVSIAFTPIVDTIGGYDLILYQMSFIMLAIIEINNMSLNIGFIPKHLKFR